MSLTPPEDAYPIVPGKPYGLEMHIACRDAGECLLRTATCAQPGALCEGDILATEERILSAPRVGAGGIWAHIESPDRKERWVLVSARLPLALAHPSALFADPAKVRVGDVLATGERVLGASWKESPDIVVVHVTGINQGGDWIRTHPTLPLALLVADGNVPEGLVEEF